MYIIELELLFFIELYNLYGIIYGSIVRYYLETETH